jgi:hypothetical protein
MKYAIVFFPGYVISKNDGDKHYIGVGHLHSLYKLSPYMYRSSIRTIIYTGDRSSKIMYRVFVEACERDNIKILEAKPLELGEYPDFGKIINN